MCSGPGGPAWWPSSWRQSRGSRAEDRRARGTSAQWPAGNGTAGPAPAGLRGRTRAWRLAHRLSLAAGRGALVPWEAAALGAAHARPARPCRGHSGGPACPTHWGRVRGSSCSTGTRRSGHSAGPAPSEPPCPPRPAGPGCPAPPPPHGRPGGGAASSSTRGWKGGSRGRSPPRSPEGSGLKAPAPLGLSLPSHKGLKGPGAGPSGLPVKGSRGRAGTPQGHAAPQRGEGWPLPSELRPL